MIATPYSHADSTAPRASAMPVSHDRTVAVWLLVCCALLFAIIVVGGVTRLTHSGLSIAEWRPVTGTLPPLSDAAWADTFQLYQATPEYRYVNAGMTLAEFKAIYWWEYFHRLLGRAIGVAFLVPLLWFVVRRTVRASLVPQLSGIFVLGGLQGAMGWYMVKSGLVNDPRVSQLRLTAHFGIALLILGAMLWTALTLLYPGRARPDGRSPALRRHAFGLWLLVFTMALSGALVAGTRAGLVYNTFPLMNGDLVPPALLAMHPWFLNPVSNLATVQFDHRVLAWLLLVLVPLFWWRTRIAVGLSRHARLSSTILLGMLGVQIALGISTLLMLVPIGLAAAHQAGAVLVFAAAANAAHAHR